MVAALLDSNILVDHLKGYPQATAEIERYPTPAISIVTWIEVMVGVGEDSSERTRQFLDRFTIIGLTDTVAEGAVRLRRSHRLKFPDAVIWAAAQTTGRLLITRNTKDFPVDDPGVRAPYRL